MEDISQIDATAQSSKTHRTQCSIRMILGLTTVCGFGVAYWAMQRKHPTHAIAAYEQAPAYHGRTATIIDNKIEVRSVTRLQRDGTLTTESGDGQAIDTDVPYVKELTNATDWLDVVQVDLAPDEELIDLVEVRVFEHNSRELLFHTDPAYAWSIKKGNVIQIYGIGKPLPDEVDLWFRLYSYQPDEPVRMLSPASGESVSLDDVKLTIDEIQTGFTGWSSSLGLYPVEGKYHADCSMQVSWEVTKPDTEPITYQMVARGKDGRRVYSDYLYRFERNYHKRSIQFPMALEELDSIEIRQSRGRKRFFFDGLKLPKLTQPNAQLAPLPSFVIKPNGKAIHVSSQELAPLSVDIEVLDGMTASGTQGASHGSALIPYPDGPRELGESFSVVIKSKGFGSNGFVLDFRKRGNPIWISGRSMGAPSSSSASSSLEAILAKNYHVPIATVDEIRLTPIPPP